MEFGETETCDTCHRNIKNANFKDFVFHEAKKCSADYKPFIKLPTGEWIRKP